MLAATIFSLCMHDSNVLCTMCNALFFFLLLRRWLFPCAHFIRCRRCRALFSYLSILLLLCESALHLNLCVPFMLTFIFLCFYAIVFCFLLSFLVFLGIVVAFVMFHAVVGCLKNEIYDNFAGIFFSSYTFTSPFLSHIHTIRSIWLFWQP